jgi:hypothetical protein
LIKPGGSDLQKRQSSAEVLPLFEQSEVIRDLTWVYFTAYKAMWLPAYQKSPFNTLFACMCRW